MVKKEYDNYLNLIDEALLLAKKIPRYFSKYSNHIYCNHQKIVIIILMQKLKLTTRGIVSFLRNNPALSLHFGLIRIPVHTTIVRFFAKIKNLIGLLLDLRQAINVAIDSTGFELESKSYYYRTIWNSERKWKTKRYMKLSIVVDTDKQLVLRCRVRKKLRHDTKDFKHLLRDLNVKRVIADKGYDSSMNRRFVINQLKAVPIIPVRNHTNFYGYIKGRKKIDGRNYYQRSKVETIFSAVKRKYGSILRAKSFATQKVELISKLIVYNLERKLNYLLFIIKGCTRAV